MAKKRDLHSAFVDSETPLAKKEKKSSESSFSSPSVPTKLSISSEVSGFNGHQDTLPRLPEILSESLKVAAFTHQGTLKAKDVNNPDISYERLEFLGDAYIEIIATRAVFPRFSKFTAGQLSQKRELMVKNETLAQFSLAYGFDARASLPKDIHWYSGDKSKRVWTKTMGDIFEAYVAAVILSNPDNGFSIVEAWLTELWGPILSNKDKGWLNQYAKAELAGKIMGKGIKIKYQDDAPPEMKKKEGKVFFKIGAYLTGWGWNNEHLGSGVGWSKNEAGNNAAAQAMSNPIISKVIAVKREFDAKAAEEKKKNEDSSNTSTSIT